MSNESTALAIRQQAIDPYEPSSYAQAQLMAADFAGSKLTKCRTKEQAILVMATGHDLGISATTALRMIYVADFGQGDQVSLSADLMVALCLRDKDRCEYFRCTESTDQSATFVTRRKGDPERKATFTAADRDRAKLGKVKSGSDETATNWAKYPATMLKHRAAALLAREVYPDILGGFYTSDELAEAAAVESAPIMDAEFIEQPAADAESTEGRALRWTLAIERAASKAAAQPTIDEAIKAVPDKADPIRVALRKLVLAREAAKWEVVSGETGEATREPGSDDE